MNETNLHAVEFDRKKIIIGLWQQRTTFGFMKEQFRVREVEK
jgi:hypothetical protein